jgi:hypothetical protein
VIVHMAGVAHHVALGRLVDRSLHGLIVLAVVVRGQACQERFTAAGTAGAARWRRHGARDLRSAVARLRCRVSLKPHAPDLRHENGKMKKMKNERLLAPSIAEVTWLNFRSTELLTTNFKRCVFLQIIW